MYNFVIHFLYHMVVGFTNLRAFIVAHSRCIAVFLICYNIDIPAMKDCGILKTQLQ